MSRQTETKAPYVPARQLTPQEVEALRAQVIAALRENMTPEEFTRLVHLPEEPAPSQRGS
jgi:hypothetical protein